MNATKATCVLLLLAAISLPAAAHPTLSTLVQHDIALEVRADYLDVTVRLTFFGHEAKGLFPRIDVDGDGALSHGERKAFGGLLSRYVDKGFTLLAGGKALSLIPRYDMMIDASMKDNGGPNRIDIEIPLFARYPGFAGPSTAIVVKDHLFADSPAMACFHVSGRDGIHMTADTAGRRLTRAAAPAPPLVMTATLYAPSAPSHKGDTP